MNRAKFKTQSRGFTLTEILVAIAIFAIIFVAALMIYDRSNRVFKNSMEQSDMQQNTRVAFDNVVAELRMAGFDFDRDGTPTGDNVYQQPDEQLEYLGDHAITFRSNTDYETDSANDNGLEPDYVPAGGEIPIVTTGNDEIITYALVSDDATQNTDTISFFADVAKPRKTFPSAGGVSETQVQISGVDLCDDGNGCENPPYTLYRYTLSDTGTVVPSPVASNIRTFNITYFSDGLGVTAVTPNGGDGQYTVNSTSVTTTTLANALRGERESVQSMRLEIIGMTEVPDKEWNDPLENALPVGEQVAAAMQYRQYELQTSVIPRNLGRRGMQEPSTTPPGAPEITSVCAEGCGVMYVTWNAPKFGTVDGYSIIYDTTGPGGSFGSVPVAAGQNTFGYVPGLDPAQQYWFKIVASNSFGSERSLDSYPAAGAGIKPINYTKPLAPTLTSASGDGTVPAVDNDITLTWDIADENVAGSTDSCGNTAVEVGSISEIKLNSGYEIYRSTTDWAAGVDPVISERIWNGLVTDADGPIVSDNYTATWTDSTPKVACQTYYYKIRQKETCAAAAAQNNGGDTTLSLSDFSDSVQGEATASVAPSAPAAPTFNAANCGWIGSSYQCAFDMQWDPITTDVSGNNVYVNDYTIHYFKSTGGVEDPSSEQTISVTDTDPADGPVAHSFLAPWNPFAATPYIYNIYVSATSCTTLQSALSSPALKYPCSSVKSSGPTPGAIDGSGQSAASPYLINNPSVSVDLTLSDIIADAKVVVYVADSGTIVTDSGSNPSLVTYTPGVSTVATFNLPLSSTQIHRAEMTLTDNNGCSNTVTYYFQESVTGCCLVPYRITSGVFDASIIDSVLLPGNANSGSVTVTYTFKNQCAQDLTLKRFRVEWNDGKGGLGGLDKVIYEDGTAGPEVSVSSPGLITVPASVTAKIPANGTYEVTLLFEKNRAAEDFLSRVCTEYDDGSGSSPLPQCDVFNAANICTIP